MDDFQSIGGHFSSKIDFRPPYPPISGPSSDFFVIFSEFMISVDIVTGILGIWRCADPVLHRK